MNILWLSPTPSHPQDAGNRTHIHALGKKLMENGHEITFLLYDQEWGGSDPDALEEMNQFWTDFIVIPHKIRSRKKSQGPFWGVDDWFNIDIESAVRFIKGQKVFDVIFCEYIFLSKALDFFTEGEFKILNCHDRMSDRHQMMVRNNLVPDFFYTAPEEETKALNRADLVLAIQEDEKKFFEKLTNKSVLEVNSPIDRKIIPSRKNIKKIVIGYLGSNNSLNVKSLQLFFDAIQHYPALYKKIKIVIGGNICNHIQKPKNFDTEYLGFVKDEADFFKEIDLFINPMIDGTGLKIKTLSALRHGTPFLATKSASAGIPTEAPQHQCDDINNLAKYLLDICKSPEGELQNLKDESIKCLNKYQSRIKLQFDDLLRAVSTKSVTHIRMKRVLLVTDIPFWNNGIGSHSRILSLCQVLVKKFSLKVFYLGEINSFDKTKLDDLELSDAVISYNSYKNSVHGGQWSTADTLSKKFIRGQDFQYAKSFIAFLNSWVRFDAIIYEYLWLAHLAQSPPYRVFKILDAHDIMSLREYRLRLGGITPSVSLGMHEELSILSNFDAVIAIQSEESRVLAALLKNHIIICCPHAIETLNINFEDIKKNFIKGDLLKLGFIGSASEENFHGLNFFIKEIFNPLSDLNIELHIYGQVCNRFDSSTALENIFFHGLIPSLGDIYKSCHAMINPVMYGGGLKIKSIEALAHGKPLISSPEGAAGINSPETSGIIVAKSRAQYINAILLLSRDKALLNKMSIQAYKSAHKYFSPKVAFKELLNLLENI